MYVDPYWFGLATGVILTVLVEVLGVIVYVIYITKKKRGD